RRASRGAAARRLAGVLARTSGVPQTRSWAGNGSSPDALARRTPPHSAPDRGLQTRRPLGRDRSGSLATLAGATSDHPVAPGHQVARLPARVLLVASAREY